MQLEGLTNPDLLDDWDLQWMQGAAILESLHTELYWSRREDRPFRAGWAIQQAQKSSSDPTGEKYQEAYELLRQEAEGQTMPKQYIIGHLAIFDVRELFPTTYEYRPLSQIKSISIHHEGGGQTVEPDISIQEELGLLAAIHRYHLPPRFLGIAYPMVVFPSGRTYLTGDWDTIRYVVGWKHNPDTLSVLLHGDFTDQPPIPKQLEAARVLVANIRMQLGDGTLPVVGHQDIAAEPTACPGRTWPEWRDALVAQGGSEGDSPVEPEDPPEYVDTRSDLHIQLDSLWGISVQLGDHPLAAPMQESISIIKREVGLG